MRFRRVPLIRHEIQFKTWSSPRFPACFDSAPDTSREQRAWPPRSAYVGVSALVNKLLSGVVYLRQTHNTYNVAATLFISYYHVTTVAVYDGTCNKRGKNKPC